MRADRLLSIMLMLQSRGRMTAQELAHQLEVTVRTIYRDIEALSYAGVPVYTQTGSNGGVFLDEKYRVSLTGLSKSDIQSLVITSTQGPLADLGLEKKAEESLLKLLAALPAQHQDEAQRMRQRFYIDPVGWFQSSRPIPHLDELQQAVWEDRLIQMVYRRTNGTVSERSLQALGLVSKDNTWYLIGRQSDKSLRNFRINRIEEVRLTETKFERSPDFDLRAYWEENCREFEAKTSAEVRAYTAVVRMHPDVQWLAEYIGSGSKALSLPDAEGWVEMEITFVSRGDACSRILSLCTQAEIIAPQELRDDIIAMAADIIHIYQ